MSARTHELPVRGTRHPDLSPNASCCALEYTTLPVSKSSLAKLSLLLSSALFCLVVAEVGARILLPDQFYVWSPNTHRTNDTTAEFLHGVWGPASFTINAHGMRGDSYHAAYGYRILAVGGMHAPTAVQDEHDLLVALVLILA